MLPGSVVKWQVNVCVWREGLQTAEAMDYNPENTVLCLKIVEEDSVPCVCQHEEYDLACLFSLEPNRR